jgi:hypothetical protein
MKRILAGASLDITLKFADFENVKPGFWAGLEEDVSDDLTDEDIANRIGDIHTLVRGIIEDRIDNEIYDVKEVKVFSQIKRIKGSK